VTFPFFSFYYFIPGRTKHPRQLIVCPHFFSSSHHCFLFAQNENQVRPSSNRTTIRYCFVKEFQPIWQPRKKQTELALPNILFYTNYFDLYVSQHSLASMLHNGIGPVGYLFFKFKPILLQSYLWRKTRETCILKVYIVLHCTSLRTLILILFTMKSIKRTL